MAVSYVDLGTANKRVKWFNNMIYNLEADSYFAKLTGKGKGDGVVVRESDQKAGNTFYVEGVGIVDGAPIGADYTLTSYTDSVAYGAVTGYRGSYAQAVAATKMEQSHTSHKFRPDCILGLRKHWGRTFDAICVDACSAYSYGPATADQSTTAVVQRIANPTNASNITAFEAIVNLADIGNTNVASSKNVNVFFAGEDTANGGGARSRPAVSTWDDAVANPTAYLLDEASCAYAYTYFWNRGMPPIGFGMDWFSRPPYLWLTPSAAIDAMRQGSAYRNAVLSGDVSAGEMWTGKMRFESIHGLMIMPFDHRYPFSVTGVSNNTLLRTKNSTDGKYVIVESLVLGAQSLATDSYDEFEIRDANEDDFGRAPKVGYDIIKGAVAIERTYSITQGYRNCGSFIFAMKKWA